MHISDSTVTALIDGANSSSLNVLDLLEKLRKQEERRHEQSIEHLDRVTRLMQEVVQSKEPQLAVMVSFSTAALRSGRALSPLQIVTDSANSFEGRAFTLEELCARVTEKFPGIHVAREVISRRLYDLRHGSRPLVVLADPRKQIDCLKEKQRLYRYVGPP